MKTRLYSLLLILLTLTVGGCASRQKKSFSGSLDGESPSIHYTGRESAGGPLGGR